MFFLHYFDISSTSSAMPIAGVTHASRHFDSTGLNAPFACSDKKTGYILPFVAGHTPLCGV